MRHLRRGHWDLLLLATLVAGLALIAAGRAEPGRPAAGERRPASAEGKAPAPLVGHPAPDFALADLEGREVRLSDLRGEVVLVNIWATWCPPCRAEMPLIEATYAEHRGSGFTVLAVSQGEAAEVVRAYIQAGGLSFPVLLDSGGEVGRAYEVSVLPSSLFVDRAGVVRAVYRGPLPRGALIATVEELLAEAP